MFKYYVSTGVEGGGNNGTGEEESQFADDELGVRGATEEAWGL